MEYILTIIVIILIPMIPFSYWLGGFMKENKLGAFLSSSRFKDTNYREWKEWCKFR